MSKPEKVHDEAVIEAAQHHSDLNVFHALVAILEGGTLYSQSAHRAAGRIIRICNEERQKQLRLYDAALRKAGVE
jgi:hypothetical protein